MSVAPVTGGDDLAAYFLAEGEQTAHAVAARLASFTRRGHSLCRQRHQSHTFHVSVAPSGDGA
jgi:hypothetical protein